MLRARPTWVAGAVCGILVAVLGALLLSTFGGALHFLSYDLLFCTRPDIRPREAVIVYMDQESHEALRQSESAPWDRNLHAKLLERLRRASVRAVVFDVHFGNIPGQEEATTNFANAIRRQGAVALGIDVERFGVARVGIGGRRLIPPADVLIDAASHQLGLVAVEPSDDLVVRKHAKPDDFYPSLAWAGAVVAKTKGITDDNMHDERWINYYGPPGILPSVSYHLALNDAEVGDEFFRDKTVFVGGRLLTKFIGERKDEFRSPYSRRLKEELFVSGVEVQATMFLNLLRNDWLRRLSGRSELGILLGVGALAGFGLMQRRPWIAALYAGLGALFAAALAYHFFTQHWWFPWVIVVAVQIPVALAASVIYQSFQLYVQGRLLEQTLAQHSSPALVKQLLKRRELLRPGAEKQQLTIMFTDIADFTKVAEGLDSDKLADLMNRYFQEAIACVHATDGFLVKQMGDSLFAVWNAPLPQKDHQRRALRTAALLQGRLEAFPALRTRIGIHTGIADVGNFGSTSRLEYSAIGESVNLASRIEGLNKFLGTMALASSATIPKHTKARYVGRFRLKGFEKAVDLHELNAEASQAFATGLSRFQSRDWDAAETCFVKAIKTNADDRPAQFYLRKIEELRVMALPEDWRGEIELSEK